MKNETFKSSDLIEYYGAALEKYLENTDILVVVILDENLAVQNYNKPFRKLIYDRSSFKRVKIDDIQGQTILNFLMPESQTIFNFQKDCFIKSKLNFSVSGSPAISISCYIFRINNITLIIGEQITLTDINFMDKMSQLNNEMANMVREIQHKNREIQQNNLAIEQKNSALAQKNLEIQQKNLELEQKNVDLEKAWSEIKTLTGIIPICMHCKKIRDDQGYWNQVETYISQHSDAQFSHGICPKCIKKYYSEYM
ncbi:MAG: hypothetical protein HQK73_06985 [Desulfamplus sp.]|nr:hypothetical protein [Desulfamplus sp.]